LAHKAAFEYGRKYASNIKSDVVGFKAGVKVDAKVDVIDVIDAKVG